MNKEIIKEFEKLEYQEEVSFVLSKMRAKIGDVAVDDMIEVYKNFTLNTLKSQRKEIVEKIIKYIRSGKLSGSFSEGCDCKECDKYEKKIKNEILKIIKDE